MRSAVLIALALAVAGARAEGLSTPIVASPPPVAAEGGRAARIDAAITRVSAYFARVGTRIKELDVIMVTSLLSRHFGIRLDMPTLEECYQRLPQLRFKQFQLHDLFFADRRVPPGPLASTAEYLQRTYGRSIDGLTDWSMYCHAIPLPADFVQVLTRVLDQGGYWVPHAGLQLRNALINRCLTRTPEVDKLESEIVRRLREGIDGGSVTDDIRIESIVILYYLGRGDAVRPSDLDWILDHQRPDGGWLPRAEATESHNHTSMLALWGLLEARSHPAAR